MVTLANEPNIPAFARDLIEQLDRAYPARCIGIDETLEQAHRYAGARALIDEMMELLEEDEDVARKNASEDPDRG